MLVSFNNSDTNGGELIDCKLRSYLTVPFPKKNK